VIRRSRNADGRLRLADRPGDAIDGIVWLDLLSPTAEEAAGLEAKLGVDLPTREEMEEIEVSSRLYYEDGAAFMTATLPAQADRDNPLMAPVTFVLTADRLTFTRWYGEGKGCAVGLAAALNPWFQAQGLRLAQDHTGKICWPVYDGQSDRAAISSRTSGTAWSRWSGSSASWVRQPPSAKATRTSVPG